VNFILRFLLSDHFTYLDNAAPRYGSHLDTRERFVSEVFTAPKHEVNIAAKILRQRLPEAIRFTQERYETIYKEDKVFIEEVKKSFTDFVDLIIVVPDFVN
jgi:hypothetical protein